MLDLKFIKTEVKILAKDEKKTKKKTTNKKSILVAGPIS